MEVLTVKFQELWNDFISSFKGSLITEANKQELSLGLVKIILSDAVSTWSSEYTINGRWLYKLMQDEPEKGKLVKEIITKDISLSEVKPESTNPENLKYIIPIGAGAIGYGAAYMAGLATVGTACSTLIPMAVAYPLAKTHISNKKSKEKERMINSYVDQLNKYKEAVISALMAE